MAAQINDQNLWKEIEFALDDQPLRRRLVPEVKDFSSGLSANSPVGEVLLGARPGDELVATTPNGNSLVKVLKVV